MTCNPDLAFLFFDFLTTPSDVTAAGSETRYDRVSVGVAGWVFPSLSDFVPDGF